MSNEKQSEVIYLDELRELSVFLDLAKERGLDLSEAIERGNRETMRLTLTALMNALEEGVAIVRAVETIPVEHKLS